MMERKARSECARPDPIYDATISWVTAQQGASPCVLRAREPRSSTATPDLSFNYFPAHLSVKGQPYLIQDGASGTTIFSSEPKNTHKFVAADGGTHTIVNTNTNAYLPSSTTDAAGKVTNYTWSSANFLASKTTPAGTTTYTWNYMGQPLTVTTPDGLTETSTYDVQGRLLTKSYSATGQVTRKTTYTRDGSGRVSMITYPDASYEQFTYNGVGLVTLIREKNGSYTAFTYDTTGLRTSVTRGLATATATSGGETSTFVWYAAGDPSGSPARTLKSETDPRGRTTSYTYDFAGRVTNTTYADGSVRSLAYDGYGNKIVESDGFSVQYWTYDNFRRVLTYTDGMNGVTSYDYGLNGSACSCYGAGAPTLITTPAGRKTRRYYDLKGRLIQETRGFTTAEAATTTFVRDVLGRVVTTIDPDGYTTTTTYDSMGRTLSNTVDSAGLNLTTTHVYNSFGNKTSMTLPGGRTSSVTFDSMARMLTLTDPLGTVTARTYDLGGRRTSETRAFGTALARTTSYAYNLFDRVVTITHPDSTTASRTYQPGGEVASTTDELGHTTSTSESLATWSDSVGTSWSTFVTTTTDATGQASSSHSRPIAQKGGTVKTVSAAGRITESYYDANGNMVQKRDGLVTSGSGLAADLTITALSYDADGLLASTTVDPSGLNQSTAFTRDSRGNVATRTDPLGRVTTSTWDKRGNLIKTKLPDNREDLASYDALGRKTSATDPKNQTIGYTYWNDSGSQSTLTDSKNQTTTWTYNLRGQLLTKTYPNGDDHVYNYDALGRMATHVTPKNETCTYSYDMRDRQILADWSSTTPDTVKTWWADGLLKSIDNGVSKSDYAYNARHDLTSETQTLTGRPARTVSYSYDADGLRGGTTYPSAKTVALAWTSRLQLQSVSTDGPPPLAIYTYDKAGRNTAIAHENGIVESKSYNAAGELISNLHLLGSTTVDGHTYTLDATGRRTAETFSDGTTPARTYGYDATSQVTSADYGSSLTDTYAYDAMGNRTTASMASLGGTTANYTTNNANQYTTITGLTPISHDANGNLLQQNNVAYTWDSENRLLSVTPNTPALGDKSLVHTYDGQHRRVTRTIREWTASGWQNTETIQFVYDGWNVVEEYALNPVNSVLARTLTWGQDLGSAKTLQAAGGVGGLLLAEEINGTTTTAYHYHYDGNGNVTQITDLSGANAASYRYDAFGNALIATGPYAAQNRFRFSTKPLDSEVTNAPLYYYGYRYYNPVTGRWPSKDPIEEKGGVNLYGFVGNDGIDRYDLLGMTDCVSPLVKDHAEVVKCDNAGKAAWRVAAAWLAGASTKCMSGGNPAGIAICITLVQLTYASRLQSILNTWNTCLDNVPCVCP